MKRTGDPRVDPAYDGWDAFPYYGKETSPMRMKWAIAFCVIGLTVGRAARADERFPFAIPGDDTAATVTDMSALNARPAAAHELKTARLASLSLPSHFILWHHLNLE